MLKYSLDIKQSAQRELDAMNDGLFNRIDRKILALGHNPRPSGCKKLKGYKDHYIIDDAAKDCAPARDLRIVLNVFVSYSHDSPAHVERVLALSVARRNGRAR